MNLELLFRQLLLYFTVIAESLGRIPRWSC